jgi:hypothetical protein
MSEAARQKLQEAHFFLQHLVREKGKTTNNDPAAFGYFLSAFLSAGESVRYILRDEDKDKCEACEAKLNNEGVKELLDFMNKQRRDAVHRAESDAKIEWEPVPMIDLIRTSDQSHPAYGFHYFGAPAVLGFPAQPEATAMRPSHHFDFGTTQADVVTTCEQYWKILDALVQAFVQVGPHASTGLPFEHIVHRNGSTLPGFIVTWISPSSAYYTPARCSN